MLAADIMTTTVATIRPTARVEDALHELGDRGITALPVVDDDGRLVGIVSEEDLLADGIAPDPRSTLRRDREAAADAPAAGRRVGDVMTRLVITARPNQDVARLVGTMLARGIHSVPIVMGTRVVGMLSRSDVVDALARSDERIAADVTVLLRGAGLEQCRCVVLGGSVRLAGGSAADLRLASALARTVAGVRSVIVHPAVSS
ncbi:CBS domain-containing protein [Isoptericola sp. S6320L]|uniref:CBS domain-containing protein n=1 Tax=Isoptericola sp. S6320L TaxID=2926411 RepID=UPI001FF404B1|nr:CBS domain-containing protein [Isoptericola sp. S6320L]MCK0118646.1 CBS domain-containing protein [Isoptericola sp. S6320L]